MQDCSGCGDVAMGALTECSADDGVTLVATCGKALQINPAWTNPTGKWRVGSKSLFELYPPPLVRRMTAKRKVCSHHCSFWHTFHQKIRAYGLCMIAVDYCVSAHAAARTARNIWTLVLVSDSKICRFSTFLSTDQNMRYAWQSAAHILHR